MSTRWCVLVDALLSAGGTACRRSSGRIVGGEMRTHTAIKRSYSVTVVVRRTQQTRHDAMAGIGAEPSQHEIDPLSPPLTSHRACYRTTAIPPHDSQYARPPPHITARLTSSAVTQDRSRIDSKKLSLLFHGTHSLLFSLDQSFISTSCTSVQPRIRLGIDKHERGGRHCGSAACMPHA
jgi:hypothetical protein